MSLPQHLTPKPSTLCSNASLPPHEVVVDSRSSCRTDSAPFVWRILSSYLMVHALSKRVRTNNSWPNAARIPNSTAFRQPHIVDTWDDTNVIPRLHTPQIPGISCYQKK